MDGDHFELYFGTLRVGVVHPTDIDFPSLWGTITYDPSLSESQSDEVGRLSRFIALNRASTRLIDMEDESDTARELEAVNAELSAHYLDYVESEDWHLVDQTGVKHPILCPIMRDDGEIVWRWNLQGR